MTKLRRAIEQMLQKDCHEPQGLPIVWNRTERHWRSRIRFGYASIGEKGNVWFQTGHPPDTVTGGLLDCQPIHSGLSAEQTLP